MHRLSIHAGSKTIDTPIRNSYFDFIRGVAVLMVVFIHTFSIHGCTNIELFFRQIMNPGVPLFLVSSGFFLAKKRFENFKQFIDFLKHQIPKVYIPMLFWSLPSLYLALQSNPDVLHIVLVMLFGGLSIYYFILLIIGYYILLPLLKRMDPLILLIIVFFITIVYDYLLAYTWFRLTFLQTSFWRADGLVHLIGFFPTGIYLSNSERNYKIWPWILLMDVSLLGSYFETEHIMKLSASNWEHGWGFKPTAIMLSYSMIFVLFSSKLEKMYSKDNLLNRVIVYIGSISFGIYLIHCYCITIIQKNVEIQSWIILWLVTTLLTMLIISLKLMTTQKYKMILGF